MADNLRASVGANGAKNGAQDIDLISKMLWANGYDVLITDKMTNKIMNAIVKAQKKAKAPDQNGIIEPGDKTVKSLKAKYTAEARRIANTPPMYEVSFEGRRILVPQKEYEDTPMRLGRVPLPVEGLAGAGFWPGRVPAPGTSEA